MTFHNFVKKLMDFQNSDKQIMDFQYQSLGGGSSSSSATPRGPGAENPELAGGVGAPRGPCRLTS